MLTCECGKLYEKPIRGRPPARCPECRDHAIWEKNSQVVVDEDTLFSGDPALLLGTPKVVLQGRESQCTTCERVFASHHGFEFHKDFRRNPSCVEPSSLGMIARERRGLPIWMVPSDRVFPS